MPGTRKAKQKYVLEKKMKERRNNRHLNRSQAACAICLDNVTSRGILSVCDHWFCFECIYEWSKNTNTCPLCKERFRCITKYTFESNSPERVFRIKDKNLSIAAIHDDDYEVAMGIAMNEDETSFSSDDPQDETFQPDDSSFDVVNAFVPRRVSTRQIASPLSPIDNSNVTSHSYVDSYEFVNTEESQDDTYNTYDDQTGSTITSNSAARLNDSKKRRKKRKRITMPQEKSSGNMKCTQQGIVPCGSSSATAGPSGWFRLRNSVENVSLDSQNKSDNDPYEFLNTEVSQDDTNNTYDDQTGSTITSNSVTSINKSTRKRKKRKRLTMPKVKSSGNIKRTQRNLPCSSSSTTAGSSGWKDMSAKKKKEKLHHHVPVKCSSKTSPRSSYKPFSRNNSSCYVRKEMSSSRKFVLPCDEKNDSDSDDDNQDIIVSKPGPSAETARHSRSLRERKSINYTVDTDTDNSLDSNKSSIKSKNILSKKSIKKTDKDVSDKFLQKSVDHLSSRRLREKKYIKYFENEETYNDVINNSDDINIKKKIINKRIVLSDDDTDDVENSLSLKQNKSPISLRKRRKINYNLDYDSESSSNTYSLDHSENQHEDSIESSVTSNSCNSLKQINKRFSSQSAADSHLSITENRQKFSTILTPNFHNEKDKNICNKEFDETPDNNAQSDFPNKLFSVPETPPPLSSHNSRQSVNSLRTRLKNLENPLPSSPSDCLDAAWLFSPNMATQDANDLLSPCVLSQDEKKIRTGSYSNSSTPAPFSDLTNNLNNTVTSKIETSPKKIVKRKFKFRK